MSYDPSPPVVTRLTVIYNTTSKLNTSIQTNPQSYLAYQSEMRGWRWDMDAEIFNTWKAKMHFFFVRFIPAQEVTLVSNPVSRINVRRQFTIMSILLH